MIHFYIKFIICFTKPKPPVKKEKMKKMIAKPLSSTEKKGKSLEADVKELKEEIPSDTDENIVKCTENAREWCHIEYCLLDDVLPKVELNVVTWGLAAKIFHNDDSRALKTVVINDVVWIYFSVLHKILKFDDADLEAFKKSTITFTFSHSQTNMMSSAVNDWPKEFVICKKLNELDSSFSNWFSELRQTDPFDERHKEALKGRVETYKMSMPNKRNSIITMVQVSPCEVKIEKKILDVMQTFSVVRASQEVVQKKGNQKRKKQSKDLKSTKSAKKMSKSIEEKPQMELKGEVIIAGKPDVCVEKKDISTSLKYVSILVNSSKILTDDQDISFVPLTVTIQSVRNLPFPFIEKFRLRKLYAQYELANILDNVETKVVPLRGCNATFDDTRVWFLSNPEGELSYEEFMLRPSMLTLSEALLTRKFVVKLYGEAEDIEESTVEPCLFGQRATDPYISTPGHSMFLEYKPPPQMSAKVFLGSACFNLIHLIKGHLKVEASSVLTSAPISTWDPICDFEDLINQEESVADRDIILMKFSNRGIIPESIFLEYCSHIKVKVTIGCLMSHLTDHQLLLIPNIYHRLIIVFKLHECAIQMFQHIMNTNLMLTGEATSSQASTNTTRSKSNTQDSQSSLEQNKNYSHTLPSTTTQTQELQNVSFITQTITGFFLDCEEESILVLEATPHVFPHVIKFLHTLLPSEGRIIHDSSLFFTKKLYNEFFPKNILRVKLSKPLSHLLKESCYYTRKSVPEQAIQTLFLVDFLRRSRTLNCASVNQLFPSCDQLISFKNVFGTTSNSSTSCSSESNSSTSSDF